MNFCDLLSHHARRAPKRPIAVFEERSVSYREMEGWSARVAAGFAARGVGRGDVVALLSFNSIEFLVTIFAVNRLGAVAMPINWRLATPEVQYLLEHSGAKLLVTDRDTPELAIDTIRDTELAALDGPPVDPADTAADDLHRLMYTSGTTGRPKGVMITHANLAWKNLAHIVEFGFTSADVGLACGPLYHVGALDLVTTSMIAVGAPTIIHRTFDAAQVVDEIERSRVTLVWMAPAMMRAVLDEPGVAERDLSSVRVIIAGGEKLPIPYIERLQRTFPGAWLADAYGLTETVSGDTFLDPASTITKLGSCGRACLHLDLAIWDEAGRPLPAGEPGEVVLRGPKVFAGYWRDEAATAKAFAGGWFHTGDVGVLDADGYLYIVDRLKDMILSGGENIAGSEVERVLYEHPAVSECAVVGRPDAKWGEVPIAFVVLRPGADASADALIEHCRGQLAKFKVPREVTFLDALPRNPSGKILKRELRPS